MVCIDDAFASYITHIVDPPTDVVSSYCKSNCSHVENLTRFCDFLYLGSHSSNPLYIWSNVFSCEKNIYSDISLHVPHYGFCDGIVDCPNSVDEIGCPGRYYCYPNISAEWIAYDKVCDNVKDCFNGQDECDGCNFGFQSSSKFLIHSNMIFALTTAVGLSTILMNIIIGYKCLHKTARTNAGKIDQINRLKVFFRWIDESLLVFYHLCFHFSGNKRGLLHVTIYLAFKLLLFHTWYDFFYIILWLCHHTMPVDSL